MSLDKARRMLLQRLGAGQTVLLAICLDLPEVPAWCDGRDSEGRAVCFVGKHALGAKADETVQAVVDMMAEGAVPDTVIAMAFAPKASQAIKEIVDGPADEVLLDGPRGSGKTQAVPGALAILAELHARNGDPLPLQVIWLHDSLTNAEMKTARSLTAPMWGALWETRDDSRKVVLSVTGKELVHADFVGCQDQASQQRLRVECHVVCAEELIPSLEDAGGIQEDHYALALSSRRSKTADDRPVRRYVGVCTTNPGDTDTWPYARWIRNGGRPGCVRIQIPATDRQTQEERAKNAAAFANNPELLARLANGEWVGLKLGEAVAEGYVESIHVVTVPNRVSEQHLLAIGWDGGHSPSAVIGQNIDGQVRFYAGLNKMGVGMLELIEDYEVGVLRWLKEFAPWILRPMGWRMLVHIGDPNLSTPGQATITESGENIIRTKLGGRYIKGAVRWPPRREAILSLLAPRHEKGKTPLAINPGDDTLLLRKAFGGKWYYGQTPDGRVDRTGPVKPNSPYADLGDAAAYAAGWLLGGDTMSSEVPEVKVETDFQIGGVGRTPQVVSSW